MKNKQHKLKKHSQLRSFWNIKISPLVIVGLFVIAGSIVYYQVNSAAITGGLTFEKLSDHPYASQSGFDKDTLNSTGTNLCPSQNFCPNGQTLTDMAIDNDGTLIAGYGDWNKNSDSYGVAEGRVGIVPYDIADNSWGDITFTETEAMDAIRKINGNFYVPSTDPSGIRGGLGGYATNFSGNWTVNKTVPEAEHVFDIATLNGTDLWLFGSKINPLSSLQGIAAIWRSTDAGDTWSLEMTDESNPPGSGAGSERYYWGQSLGGKIYARAGNVTPAAPLRVFDGTSWSTTPSTFSCLSKKLIEVFDSKLACGSALNVQTFDGTTDSTYPLPSNAGTNVKDLYVGDDDYLYILTDTSILRTQSFNDQPTIVALNIGNSMRSIAVHEGFVYLGDDKGGLWHSTTTADNAPQVELETVIQAVTPSTILLNGLERQLSITGTDFPYSPTVTINGKPTTVISATTSHININIDTNSFNAEAGQFAVRVQGSGTDITKHAAGTFAKPTEGPGGIPTVTRVNVLNSSVANQKLLEIKGSGFLSSLDEATHKDYWTVGMRNKLVSWNGQALPACADEKNYELFTNQYDSQFFSKAAPCYHLMSYDRSQNKINPTINNAAIYVEVPNESAEHGTVQVLGGSFNSLKITTSNEFTY